MFSAVLDKVVQTQAYVCYQASQNCNECPSLNPHQVHPGDALEFECPEGTQGPQLKLENADGKFIITTEVEAYGSNPSNL